MPWGDVGTCGAVPGCRFSKPCALGLRLWPSVLQRLVVLLKMLCQGLASSMNWSSYGLVASPKSGGMHEHPFQSYL